jgi:hypothetical protein
MPTASTPGSCGASRAMRRAAQERVQSGSPGVFVGHARRGSTWTPGHARRSGGPSVMHVAAYPHKVGEVGRSEKMLVWEANRGGPRTPRGGSRLRLAGAATQTGFPEERETASEWERGTHTCCFRRPSSSRSPERASASTAASRITTSPPVRKKTPSTRQSDCSPAGSAVRFGRVVCEVCCDTPKTMHRLVLANKPPSPTYTTGPGPNLGTENRTFGSNVWKNTGSNPEPSHGPKQ